MGKGGSLHVKSVSSPNAYGAADLDQRVLDRVSDFAEVRPLGIDQSGCGDSDEPCFHTTL
eukprot:8495476-Pyramimonas_sp.AAC.2